MKTNTVKILLHNSKEYKKLDKELNGILSKSTTEFKEKDSTEVTQYGDLIRIEKRDIKSAKDARKFGGAMYLKYKKSYNTIHFDISTKFNDNIKEGATLASYEFWKYKTTSAYKHNKLDTIEVNGVTTSGIAKSVAFARDLVSEPGNVLYPSEYANRINDQLSPLGVNVKIYHQAQLQEMGLKLLLSVGQGSEKDSYVVVMEYMNGEKEDAPFALVGKGVTFDTGGISLKPGRNMGDMKYDMGGSAAVVGAVHAIASQKVKKNVVGIVGLVENMPDGTAIKPGDVVTSLSGQTVENLNTDAEGRLVLADILTYVQSEYKPCAIIDLATLTGAIVATLGHEMAGLFTNSTDLANTIIANGELVNEGFFRMPMGKNWNKMIDSDIADMQNIGGPFGGSTTAAEFLYRFVDKKTPWAHLDIAGMAWDKTGSATTPKGAVGFGVQTLFSIIENRSKMGGDYFWFNVDEKMSY
jgi:leucyl aminopeptidase